MPTIKFRNPAHASGAEQVAQLKTKLKDLEQELALRQDTGRDLVTQLLWEKESCKEAVKKYAGLQQEHLKLQNEHTAYVLAAARAEQAHVELQAKLQDLQEELFNVEVARDSNWEDYRQALIANNKLTQEVESLKAQVAAMQKAHSLTPAQLKTQSTVKFPFASPDDRVNTASPTISSAQVKRAAFAGLGRSPLSNISNTQGIGRLQTKRTTPTALSLLGLSTSPRMRPPSALLGGDFPTPTSSDHSPAIKSPMPTEAVHTPVVTPKADLLLPPPASDATGLFAPAFVGTHSLWARSPSVDSQTYREMFRPASSCESDCEEHAPSSTPKPSWVSKAGSSHSSSGKGGAAFTPPEIIGMPKVGSCGEDSPPRLSHISGSPQPLSTSAAVIAVPAPAKAGGVRYLSYRCTDGSCSCLSSLDSDESSSEASQGLQSAQSPTPPGPSSGIPKYLSRQEVLEEHWGYGHSSCNDSDSDVSAVSGCTICSGTKWTPAATASSPALYTYPDCNTLHLDTGVSCGELSFEPHWLLLDSPLSTASAKSLCPVASAMAIPPSQLSPASPQAACHTSTGTANIPRSTSATAAATAGPTAVMGGPSSSSVKITRPSPIAAVPTTTATARHSCRATASPGTAEARGSAVQGGRAAAPRPALRTSSAAGKPMQRGALHQQSTTVTAVPAALQQAPPAASPKSTSVGNKKAANKRLHPTAVPAAAVAGVTTRGQAAAAAQHKTTPTSVVGAASSRPRQAHSLKPEAPTRRQPQRAAKPQWR